jgi:hypothetical protein
MPLAPLILPLGSLLAVSASMGNQLDWPPGSEFGPSPLRGRDRGGACRNGRQSNQARKFDDHGAHFSLHRAEAR